MKKLILLFTILLSSQLFAETHIFAKLVKNNTYLSIRLVDDQVIPPFFAGELWKLLRENQQIKTIRERELNLSCEGLMDPTTNDTFGSCTLLIPFELLKKIKSHMVFKAEGEVAIRLNSYFIDSAYFSTLGNEIYLSAFNTRRQFFFGINEQLIQK